MISSKLKSSGVRPSSRPADAGCGAGAGGAAGRGASGAGGASCSINVLNTAGVREASPGTRGAEGHSIVAAGARPAAGDAERAAGAGGASCSINVLNTAAPILRSFAMRAARASAEGAGGGAAKLFSAARRLASACAEAAELICSMGINAIVGASTLTSPKENEMVEYGALPRRKAFCLRGCSGAAGRRSSRTGARRALRRCRRPLIQYERGWRGRGGPRVFRRARRLVIQIKIQRKRSITL